MITVYYSEKVQINISQGTGHIGSIQEAPNTEH